MECLQKYIFLANILNILNEKYMQYKQMLKNIYFTVSSCRESIELLIYLKKGRLK
jgi:hypothetical protein